MEPGPHPISQVRPRKKARPWEEPQVRPPFRQTPFGACRAYPSPRFAQGRQRKQVRPDRLPRLCTKRTSVRAAHHPRFAQGRQRGPGRCPRFARLSAKRPSGRAARKTRAKMGCLPGPQRRGFRRSSERRNLYASSKPHFCQTSRASGSLRHQSMKAWASEAYLLWEHTAPG